MYQNTVCKKKILTVKYITSKVISYLDNNSTVFFLLYCSSEISYYNEIYKTLIGDLKYKKILRHVSNFTKNNSFRFLLKAPF